jgi:CRP-like cAMP-binding protein
MERRNSSENPLIKRLSHFAPLSDKDVRVLSSLCAGEKRYKAGSEIEAEGAAPRSAFAVTHGMACRYRLLPDGKRQILTFLIPGDVSDLHVFLLKAAIDHSAIAIVPTRIVPINRDTALDIIAYYPRVAAALWWSAIQEHAILHERIVALGRRNARARVAYLLCEFVWRLQAIGMHEDDTIRLPLTQTDLADTLGLTSVHVNRVLQGFRQDGLISLARGRLTLTNFEELQAICGFTPNYLQLSGIPTEAIPYVDNSTANRPED